MACSSGMHLPQAGWIVVHCLTPRCVRCAVKSGHVHLNEAAAIRDTALRAVDENEAADPEKSPNGKALWMRAKSIAADPLDRGRLTPRSPASGPGLLPARWEWSALEGSFQCEGHHVVGWSVQCTNSLAYQSIAWSALTWRRVIGMRLRQEACRLSPHANVQDQRPAGESQGRQLQLR